MQKDILQEGRLRFEWDEKKEQINIRKHGIDFKTASHVFLDERRIEYYDEAHSSVGEDRFITIGSIGEVIMVVYTEREDALRIISARLATKKERRIYYYGYREI
ncbi:MAG: BrnT family toxin [Firmicutes bacterium]|nr:BrnT family toxin [Bacillota bacterium]